MYDRSYWRLIRDPGFAWLLAAQFLGALNDNIYRWAITFFALDLARQPGGGWDADVLVAVITATLMVPFLIFSNYAGQLADRFSKRSVLIATKSLEIVAMFAALGAFFIGDITAMIVALFLMGAQSALYSPAKYGSLPELLPDRDLSRGNALIEMSTFLAIILGGVLGGTIYEAFRDNLPMIGVIAVGIAIVGTLCSFGVGRTPPGRSTKRFTWNPLGDVSIGLRELHANRRLWLTVLGLSYFWFVGALVQQLIPLFGDQVLKTAPTETQLLGAVIAIGIAIGSLAAGRLSGHKVELGLVPIGAVGMGIGAFVLAGVDQSYTAAAICLAVLGFFGGMYSVPLNAMLQQKADEGKRGRFIAANNVMNTFGIMLASGFLAVSGGLFDLSPSVNIALAGVTALLVIAYLLILLPDFLIRFCLWMLTHSIYRIRIVGPENVPLNGPALLVANHLSFIDGLLIGACVQRFVRFMVYAPFFEIPLLGKLFTLMRAIPTGGGGARGAVGAIRRAREELAAGHVVCIFAEGAISRTGNMLPFKRGFEKITEGLDVPVIPVHLDQVWGSIFSFKDGRFFWKWPSRLLYPVTITFGRKLPATARAWDVRQKLLEMGGDAFRHRRKKVDLVHRRFVAQAKRSWRRFAMTDSLGQTVTFGKALTGAFLLARKLDQVLPDNRHVGVLLPASVGGALVNMALLLGGKVPVNLNFTIGPEAMQAAIDKAGIEHIIAARPFLAKAKLDERPGMVFVEDIMKSIGKFERVFYYVALRLLPVAWIERMAGGGKSTPDDLCTIMFSSGSTGTPKGVMLSHHNIMSNLEAIAQILWIQPDDRMMGVLPFFHSFGFTGTLCVPLVCGIGAVYHPNPLDAKTIGKLARENKATILISTPTFCQAYYRTCGPEDFESLRHVVVGAERLRPDFAVQFKEKFGLEMLEGYGCTEMGPVVSVNVPNVVHGKEKQVGHKPGTVGHPLPGVTAKVVDPENGHDLAEGQEGLLLLKGPGRMVGYLADDNATAAALRDGWYVTGDIAVLDEDGFIRITDRLSRFSKIGGEMVPHLKVEEAMLRTPGVEAACVTAVPDAQRGERLVGFYVANEAMAPQLIWQALGESDLPKIWIPKATDLRRIEALPVLGTGKIDLRAVKTLAAAAE
ncbi:acyl-[ACP]--phospholipid O-acyltransferase [Dongia deserti]|uniref:acyl-[ACP]--phospholipid O-acyltransferase n=1 Tax=Dongia deserti TaxID=2268030 RepID=UPI0013C52447|nr:acyl-[ACP]--phospholipid O-acyltransferase [Dongia deserti]